MGEQWHYYYDTPIDSNYPATYTSGRLAAVMFGGFTYEYGYNPAGRVTMQRMQAGVGGASTSTPPTRGTMRAE